MTKITLKRRTLTPESTIGILEVFGEAVCTMEDTKRPHKVFGETRIPAGCYRLELRNEGGMTQRYAARFPNMHQGMIWLRRVPMFEHVYIHIGNWARDTEGCILVGLACDKDMLLKSKAAYQLIYPLIVEAIENDGCCIVIEDEGRKDA